MSKCRQCGTDLPKIWSTDMCLECSRKSVKQIFEEYPDVKECFMETIRDLKAELESKTNKKY